MRTVSVILRQIVRDRRGVSSTELGVVLALVALGSLQALTSLGQEVEQDLDLARTEVADNRAYADPFGRGRAAAQDSSTNRSSDSGTDGLTPEPPASDDGGVPEPAAASVAPEMVEWGMSDHGGGGGEPPAAVRVIPPRP